MKMCSGAKVASILCTLAIVLHCLAPPEASADVSLKVWPTTLEMTVSEGQTAELVVNVENAGDEIVRLSVYAMDYTVDRDGNYSFSEPVHDTYSCAAWISPDASVFDLAPGETRATTVSISVPENIEPGEHHSAVFFEQLSDVSQGTSVSVGARMACLLYVTIPRVTDAEVTTDANIAQVILPGWAEGSHVNIGALIRNSGNVHLTLAARAYLTNFRGSPIGEADLGQAVILPGGERLLEATWADLPLFGRVSARVVIGYHDSQGELVNKETSVNFQVVPWKTIMVVVLCLTIIGLAVFIVVRRFRFRLALERRCPPY